VTIANWNHMRERPDVFRRFVGAYRESVDWLYSDPQAVKMYAAKTDIPEDIIDASNREFQPREALQTDEIRDLEGTVRDAMKLKFLDKPLTQEQLTDLIRIPPRQ
jgi:NitT/TauT family transport system substrate-binding protein